jgi:hypothetical protein
LSLQLLNEIRGLVQHPCRRVDNLSSLHCADKRLVQKFTVALDLDFAGKVAVHHKQLFGRPKAKSNILRVTFAEAV